MMRSITLNQDIVKKMASTICDLKTKWSVTEPQADAVYGLDTPNAIVTLIASDGTSIQCSFGGNDAEDDTCATCAAPAQQALCMK